MEKEEERRFLVKQSPRELFEPESPALSAPVKPKYPSFNPIKYSEIIEEKSKRERETLKIPVSKKQENIILQPKPKKKNTLILLLAVLVVLMLMVYIYLAYFSSPDSEFKLGDNIDDAYIKEGVLYVHLLPADYESAEKIDFFLADSEGEHPYSTHHLVADHEIYPEDASLENFDDLRMIYAKLDYSAPYPLGNSTCGNNAIDIGESCDNNNLSGKTCDDFFIHGEGNLACCPDCSFNLQNCRNLTYTLCTDSDFGNDYYKLGSISAEFNYTKGEDCNKNISNINGLGGSYYQDKCSDDILTEYYCMNDKSPGTTKYDCSLEGKVCELGKCVEPMFSSLNVWDSLSRLFRKTVDKIKNA